MEISVLFSGIILFSRVVDKIFFRAVLTFLRQENEYFLGGIFIFKGKKNWLPYAFKFMELITFVTVTSMALLYLQLFLDVTGNSFD